MWIVNSFQNSTYSNLIPFITTGYVYENETMIIHIAIPHISYSRPKKSNRFRHKSPIELIFGIWLPFCDPKNPFNHRRKRVAQAIYPVETNKYFTYWEINSLSAMMRGTVDMNQSTNRPTAIHVFMMWMWVLYVQMTQTLLSTIKMEND